MKTRKTFASLAVMATMMLRRRRKTARPVLASDAARDMAAA